MYQEFFSLKIKPFSISPDPNFLFLSERHKEAIAHLQHGLQSRAGFALLTGEVGTGKTTICRSLIEGMEDNSDIASILNSALNETELLSSICDCFNIKYDANDEKQLFDILETWIINNYQQHRRTVIIIDEAQHLSFAALKQLRLLTEIETQHKKPVQVILIGQTELQEKLKQAEFRQLAQSITARYHLLSLSQQESNLYIQHRLQIAGSNHALFDKSALREIFKKCAGIPRLTNILCDRSLLAAYTQDSHIVTLKMVKQASTELHFQAPRASVAKTHWRFILLLTLSALTAWQAPQILNQFSKEVLTLNISEPAPLNNIAPPPEKLIEEKPQQAQWFDAYPQLDLSKTRYNDALVSLYALWGYQVDSNINCKQANSAHLHCYSSEINLQQLKKLNYPSIVRLEKESGTALYAVIYRIADDYQLLIDGNLISVTEQWFSNYWRGATTLLWQAPFALEGVIKLGQKGDKVAWLAKQLNKEQLPSDTGNFDLQLLEQVRKFQRQQGLVDDGIVGPKTLMPLMHLAMPNNPKLLQETN